MKADKNRMRVEEEFLKSSHAQRIEAAAVKKEEKRRQEKVHRSIADRLFPPMFYFSFFFVRLGKNDEWGERRETNCVGEENQA